MKSRVLIILFVLILVCAALPVGCNTIGRLRFESDQAHAQAFAQQIADALGRTPANSIVDFRSCGMIDCHYNVLFHTPDDQASLDARVHALSMLNLKVQGFGPNCGADPLNIVNGGLLQIQIRGRLDVAPFSRYRDPAGFEWSLQNERGEDIGSICLWMTKDRG
jgi:hypothetical protein